MKKKGFTLIELIATIVILSIILLIAVPRISNITYASRKNAFETNAYSLVSMAEKLYQNSYAGSLKESGIVYDIENGKILYNGSQVDLAEGKIDGNGFIQIYSNGESKIAIENDEFCALKEFTDGKITVTDKEEGVACGKIYVAFSYEPNGGVVTQEFKTSYLERTKIELLDPTRENYNFLEWVVVKGNSTINNKILTIGNTDTEIYALWTNNPAFDIDLLGGTSSQIFKNTYPSGTTIVLEEPSRLGYTFKRWEKEYGNSVISGNDFTMGTEDTKIKPIWEINSYTISYNLDGGTNASGNPISGTYGSTVTINNPTKVGHTFNGWTVAGASMDGTNLTIDASDVTLTANWNINTYTITYNLNGGATSSENPTSGTYGSTITLNNPTKTYYVFTGWSVTGTGSSLNTNTNELTIGTGDVVLTANWKPLPLIASYSCANTSSGSNYMFTYTGNCEVIDDVNDNWKVKFLTSGTFTPSIDTSIDVFLVGGGGNGGTTLAYRAGCYGYAAGGGGGGGGYRTTTKNVSIAASTGYPIVIGAAKQASTGFGSTANGGSDGTAATDLGNANAVGKGGAGGSKGGSGGLNTIAGLNGEDGGYAFDETSGERYGGGGGGGHGHHGEVSTVGTVGSGGLGGGGCGNSTYYGNSSCHNGAANTGGGGGGASYYLTQTNYYPNYSSDGYTWVTGTTYEAGTGGSGIVIIRNVR